MKSNMKNKPWNSNTKIKIWIIAGLSAGWESTQ